MKLIPNIYHQSSLKIIQAYVLVKKKATTKNCFFIDRLMHCTSPPAPIDIN